MGNGKGRKPDYATFAGLALAVVGILGGLALENGQIQDVSQVTALLIVFGGTLGAVLVSTPATALIRAFKHSSVMFFEEPRDDESLVARILHFTAQFAINGQRGVEATFAMDGADISDPEMGGSTFSNFNVDAVEGIDSSSGWMPAEIGRGAAGFTNIHTRSGASGFHGSVFEFVRNSAFDARNYFDHPTPEYPGRIPPFRRNEFGFTNGGPVFIPHVYDGRQRSYYFTQYQGFRQVLGTTQVMPVPSAAQRPGNGCQTNSQVVCDTVRSEEHTSE